MNDTQAYGNFAQKRMPLFGEIAFKIKKNAIKI